MKKITGMALGLAFVFTFSVWAGGGGQGSAGGAAKSNVTLTMMVSQGWTTAGDEEIIRKFSVKKRWKQYWKRIDIEGALKW